MTEPDDGLEDALRRAMSAAANEAAPGPDGLSRIRARIGNRPPRPWLLSVLAGWAERARNWTWRGQWAWQPFALRRSAAFPAPRGLPTPRPGLAGTRTRGAGLRLAGLKLGAALAGIASVAVVSLGVQPFRHAIIEASSTVFDGGSRARAGAAGTESSTTPTLGSSVANYATTQPPRRDAASAVPDAARSAAARSTQAGQCVSPAVTPTTGTPTTGTPATGTRTTGTPATGAAAAGTPTAGASTALTHTPTAMSSPRPTGSKTAGLASPSGSGTVKETCPMPTATATASPAASPTPIATSPSPSASASATPTPTATATSPRASSTYTYTWAAPTRSPDWYRPTYSPTTPPKEGKPRQ